MPVRIFNNIASINSQRILGTNNGRLAQSVERISSGIKINKGADDAAGLAISESLRSDIRTLRQAVRNGNDGVSMINITEGALNEQGGILIRLRELASQAATGTVGSTERQTIQLEFNALRNELDRISATTEFNGQNLIDGSLASSVTSADQILEAQHGVNWISEGYPGEGNLILFNNFHGDWLSLPVNDWESAVYEIETPLMENLEYQLNEEGVFGPSEPVWVVTGIQTRLCSG